MKTRPFAAILVFGFLCAGGHALGAAQQGYRIVDLGSVLGSNSYAQAINARGEVAGYWNTGTNGVHAFLYSQGTFTDLGSLGGSNRYALNINAAGQVVGFSETGKRVSAFLFSNGGMTNVGSFWPGNSYAFGINNSGHIVGYTDTAEGAQAFLLEGGFVTSIGTLGGTNSFAFGINSAKQVTGASLDKRDAMQAFLWQNGSLLNLNELVSFGSGWELHEARGINDFGHIVGWGRINNGEHAFLFVNGLATDLGVLRGGTTSYALGLNNNDQVVGGSSFQNGVSHAFVWENGKLSDLNDLVPADSGWELRQALGINDLGQIVGWGVANGQERAVLLEPVDPVRAQGSMSKSSAVKSVKKSSFGEVGIFSILSGGSSTPVTNSPLADAHVRAGTFTNTNFGTNTVMELETSATANTNRDVYLKFDISNGPSPLGSAKLRIFTKLSASGSVTGTVYAVSDTNWTETGITWTNKPALGSALTNQVFNVLAGTNFLIDVTSYVASELNAGRTIITLGLHCGSNSTILASINSKENSTNKPALILNTNAFPAVSITNITNNASFSAPTNLTISASASDSDGTITNVQFFAGSVLVGSDATSPYSVVWSNAPVGTYALTARATDNLGTLSTSAVVNITLTTNFIAMSDAHVVSTNVTKNFGTNTILEVQTNAAVAIRDTYLKFNVSGITNVGSAKIHMFANLSAVGTNSVSAYSVNDTNWVETSIAWSNRPPISNLLSTVMVSGTNLAWYTIDVTSFVQSELAAGRSVLSLGLHCRTNSTLMVKINSREAVSNRIELSIATTNSAPFTTISSPIDNVVLAAPVNIPITATALDIDGTVTQVEILAGAASLGVLTNGPYSLTFSNAPLGTNLLTARATDNWGAISTSTVVRVIVDTPPSVSLTAPADGSMFVAPATIILSATASDSDGSVSQVEFFEGTTSLGVDSGSPYTLTWTNVSAGSYALTARVTDNIGMVRTSAVINVLVDLPPSVTITNPVSGTNVTLPADILVAASASDGDGTISQVDFYAGAIWIGAAQSAPYSVTWSNAPAGVFALTAVATDNLGVTTTSAIVYVTNNVFSPSSLSGLRLWLDAGAGVTTNGAAQISLWADQSGRTNNALQGTLSNQPLLVTNALNGRPVVRFDGTNDQFGFQNNPFLGATQGEMFIVVKARVDSPGVHRALAFFGASDFTYYPHDSGQIYDQFGSTVIKALGDPGQPLDQFGIYSSSAAPKDWSARLNGVLLYRTTNNTVGFASTPLLGTGNGTSYFDGDVAELLIYNRTLTAAERDAVGGYLAGKFALASAPVAPTNLTAKAISSNQVSLAWSGVVTNQLTKYVVERKQGTNGTYASIAEVENGLSYLDTGLAGGTQYFYRVKARNYAGESGYSNEADATTVAGVTAMPITELVLWLKADAGARGRKSERLGGPVRKGQQCGAGERCGSASCGGWGGEWASGNPV